MHIHVHKSRLIAVGVYARVERLVWINFGSDSGFGFHVLERKLRSNFDEGIPAWKSWLFRPGTLPGLCRLFLANLRGNARRIDAAERCAREGDNARQHERSW